MSASLGGSRGRLNFRVALVVVAMLALCLCGMIGASAALATTLTFTNQDCGSVDPANLFLLPPGVSSVAITATGSAGGSGTEIGGTPVAGGTGDVVSGILTGLSQAYGLDICVNHGGGTTSSYGAGAGGGASGVGVGNFGAPVLIAGGGGGGGFGGDPLNKGFFTPPGLGGSAGLPSGSNGVQNYGGGGEGGAQTFFGIGGGPGAFASPGNPGAATSPDGPGAGGAGGAGAMCGASANACNNPLCGVSAGDGGGGGGGGAGYFGGGGGGGGAVPDSGCFGEDPGSAGGGGGGSDFCASQLPAGLSLVGCRVVGTNSGYQTASVTITYCGGFSCAPPYAFSGFFGPIHGTSVNMGHAGRTYPVQFQLTDPSSGSAVSSLSAVQGFTYQPTSCTDFSNDPSNALTTTATGGTSLRYDTSDNQYVYNWDTPGPGCYTLFLNLDSGQVFTADFDLTN